MQKCCSKVNYFMLNSIVDRFCNSNFKWSRSCLFGAATGSATLLKIIENFTVWSASCGSEHCTWKWLVVNYVKFRPFINIIIIIIIKDYFSVAELNYLISAPAPLSLSLFCLRLRLQNNFGFTGTVTLDYLGVFLQFLGHALRRDVGIKTIFALVSQL